MSTYEVVINIIYKRTPSLTLDVTYLLNKHIPMAAKAWKPHGCLGATVNEAPADSDYAYFVAVRFRTLDGWEEASKNEAQMGEIMADVPNFANGMPEFVVSKVVEGGHIEV